MPSTRNVNLALTWLACTTLAIFVLLATGCSRLANLDRTIWGTPTHTASTTEPDGTTTTVTTADPAPPLIEAVAGVLAAVGFGGMATWIRRVKKTGNGQLQQLRADVGAVAKDLADLHDTIAGDKPS